MTDAVTPPDDLRCAGCGYLLRGLDAGGRCPECNHLIGESIAFRAAMPPRRTRRALLLASVSVLAAVALHPLGSAVAYADWYPTGEPLLFNRDGHRHFLAALVLTPAAWVVARVEPSRRWRRILRALPVLLACLGLAIFPLSYTMTPVGNATLLTTYGVAPILEVVVVISLLGTLARTTRGVPRAPGHWWLRGPQVLYGGAIVLEAAFDAIICAARVMLQFHLFTPAKDEYLPPGFGPPLRWFAGVVLWPCMSPLYWLTVGSLLVFTALLFRRVRVAAG